MTELRSREPVAHGESSDPMDSAFGWENTRTQDDYTGWFERLIQMDKTEKRRKLMEKLISAGFSATLFFTVVGMVTVYHWVFG